MKTYTTLKAATRALRHLSLTLAFIAFNLYSINANAQCSNNNVFYTGISSLNPGQSYVFGCVWGGEYVTVPVIAGNQYTFSTCGGGSWDTQLTIYNNNGGSALGYNDDACGLQSRIFWTANFTGTLRVLLDQYSCQSNSSCMNITVTRGGSNTSYNPCSNITSLNCNGTSNANITSGGGAWNNYGGPYSTPGRESLYSFTPSTSGIHNITVSHSSSGWIDLFYKAANIGCNASSWTYVNDISGTETWAVTLTAGVPYYIMLDDEDINGSNASISISCPNPCQAPPGGVDFTFNAPFTHNSTTSGACNDCSLRSSTDRVYSINITCAGTYTFSTCNGASWDTYLYLTTQACGGSIIASNDDNCGLQSSIIANLNAGTYYLTVEGFSSSSAGSYVLNVSGGGTPVTGNAVISGANNVCEGSTQSYNVSGVSGATSYNWSVSGGNIISGQGSNNITVQWNNSNGIVSVVPVSSCGNGTQANYNVTVNQIPVISTNVTNVNCNGNNNGSIVILPSNSGWQYSIDGGQTYSGNNIFNSLTPGNYVVTAQVSNINGCNSQPVNLTITEPSPLSGNISTSNYNGFGVSCNGGSNGSANIQANGGTAPYTYLWSNNTTNQTAVNLNAGNYNVTITDANGCTATANTILTEPQPLNASVATSNFNGFNISCNGGSNGSATANVSGGVTPYSYLWSNNTSNQTASNLTAGNYNVLITDANGCNLNANTILTEPSQLLVSTGPNQIVYYGYTPASCATITASGSGGVPGYNYSWSGGGNQANTTVCPSVTTVYTVTVTDANGCSETGVVQVCAINVICYAGNSNIAKVQVCHIPPGNNQNPQTICINASAVPAHLAQGAYLGMCGSNTITCTNNQSRNGFSNEDNNAFVNQTIIDINLYPNPAKENISVEFFNLEKGLTTYEIKDVTGRILSSSEKETTDSYQTQKTAISVKDLPAGVYFLNITHNNQNTVKKFIVEK